MHHTLLHTGSETSDKNENSVAVLNDVNPISPNANKVPLNSIGEMVANVQICSCLTQELRVSFFTIAWIDFHTAEGRCFRVLCWIKNPPLVLYPSHWVKPCVQTDAEWI